MTHIQTNAFASVPGRTGFWRPPLSGGYGRTGKYPLNCSNHTKKPEQFLDLISGWTPENLARACEVSPADVEKLQRWYRQDRPTATFVGAGLQRYRYGGENVRIINALALLSGNIGISGGGSYFHLHSYRNLNLNWTRDPRKKKAAIVSDCRHRKRNRGCQRSADQTDLGQRNQPGQPGA